MDQNLKNGNNKVKDIEEKFNKTLEQLENLKEINELFNKNTEELDKAIQPLFEMAQRIEKMLYILNMFSNAQNIMPFFNRMMKLKKADNNLTI